MKVIATRQLYGTYGSLNADEECDLRHDIASALLKRGLVRLPDADDVKAADDVDDAPKPPATPRGKK